MKKIAFIFILFLMLSCSTSNIETSSQNTLNGKWTWVSSSGGFIGSTLTPASEKKEMSIEISKSTIKRFENGNLISESDYIIETGNSIYGNDKKMIVYKNDAPKQSFEIKDNVLYLNDECHDCYQSQYVRVK